MTGDPRGAEGPRPKGVTTPPVAVHRPKKRPTWLFAAIGVAAICAVFFVIRSPEYLTSSWVPWVIIASPFPVFALQAFGTTVSVGREWLYMHEFWRRQWVALDRLTEVDVRQNGLDVRLRLRDQQGRKFFCNSELLREDPEVWQVIDAACKRALTAPECKRNPRAEQYFAT